MLHPTRSADSLAEPAYRLPESYFTTSVSKARLPTGAVHFYDKDGLVPIGV
jgi:hypothetical protein